MIQREKSGLDKKEKTRELMEESKSTKDLLKSSKEEKKLLKQKLKQKKAMSKVSALLETNMKFHALQKWSDFAQSMAEQERERKEREEKEEREGRERKEREEREERERRERKAQSQQEVASSNRRVMLVMLTQERMRASIQAKHQKGFQSFLTNMMEGRRKDLLTDSKEQERRTRELEESLEQQQRGAKKMQWLQKLLIKYEQREEKGKSFEKTSAFLHWKNIHTASIQREYQQTLEEFETLATSLQESKLSFALNRLVRTLSSHPTKQAFKQWKESVKRENHQFANIRRLITSYQANCRLRVQKAFQHWIRLTLPPPSDCFLNYRVDLAPRMTARMPGKAYTRFKRSREGELQVQEELMEARVMPVLEKYAFRKTRSAVQAWRQRTLESEFKELAFHSLSLLSDFQAFLELPSHLKVKYRRGRESSLDHDTLLPQEG